MQHQKIANILRLAGSLAVLGILFVFYAMPVYFLSSFRMLAWPNKLPLLLPPMLIALPYLAALGTYFSISGNIGKEKSFCTENVHLLQRIARLFVLDSAMWCCVLPYYAYFFGTALIRAFSFWSCAIVLLFIMADWAVALLAYMLSRLLSRAEELQTENELTI